MNIGSQVQIKKTVLVSDVKEMIISLVCLWFLEQYDLIYEVKVALSHCNLMKKAHFKLSISVIVLKALFLR